MTNSITFPLEVNYDHSYHVTNWDQIREQAYRLVVKERSITGYTVDTVHCFFQAITNPSLNLKGKKIEEITQHVHMKILEGVQWNYLTKVFSAVKNFFLFCWTFGFSEGAWNYPVSSPHLILDMMSPTQEALLLDTINRDLDLRIIDCIEQNEDTTPNLAGYLSVVRAMKSEYNPEETLQVMLAERAEIVDKPYLDFLQKITTTEKTLSSVPSIMKRQGPFYSDKISDAIEELSAITNKIKASTKSSNLTLKDLSQHIREFREISCEKGLFIYPGRDVLIQKFKQALKSSGLLFH